MRFFKGLDEVALKGDLRAMRKAVAKGADLNRPAKTQGKLNRRPVHAAVCTGQLDMLELLIQHGAHLNVRDDLGQTPLHYVARIGYLNVLDVLLANGADHTLRDRYGNLAIHVAMSTSQRAVQDRLRQHAVETPLEVRYFEGGNWHPYDESAARAVSFEMGEGSAYCALATSTGATYIVDFRQQLQINASSLFAKSICWRVPPLGAWNYPEKPFQGLHPGSQDPRYLAQYEPLMRELRSQGLAPHPLQPPQYLSAPEPSGPSSSSSIQYPHLASSQSGSVGRSSSFFAAPVSPLPSSGEQPRYPDSLQRSFSQESSPGTGPGQERLLDPHRPSAPSAPLTPSAGSGIGRASGPANDSPPEASVTATSPMSGTGDSDDKPHFLNARPALFKTLRSGSVEYNEIVARFVAGMEKPPQRTRAALALNGRVDSPPPLRPVTVTCVYEVRALPDHLALYEGALAGRRAARGDANERLAWHGAPFQNLEQIVLTGFKLSAGSRNGRLYGQGVYFAPENRAYTSAEFAVPDENGEKHMLLCRLIAGAIEAIPFESVQTGPSSRKFDTGADNVEEPTRYVVWEDDVNEHVLPTHIVSFRYC